MHGQEGLKFEQQVIFLLYQTFLILVEGNVITVLGLQRGNFSFNLSQNLVVNFFLIETHFDNCFHLLVLLYLDAADVDHELLCHLLNLMVKVQVYFQFLRLLLAIAKILRGNSKQGHRLGVGE